jgi:hypothetical protein
MTAVTKRRPEKDSNETSETTEKMKPSPGRRPGDQPERTPAEPAEDVKAQREKAPEQRKGHGVDRDLDDRPATEFPIDGEIDEFVEQNEKRAPPPNGPSDPAPPQQAPPAERPADER